MTITCFSRAAAIALSPISWDSSSSSAWRSAPSSRSALSNCSAHSRGAQDARPELTS